MVMGRGEQQQGVASVCVMQPVLHPQSEPVALRYGEGCSPVASIEVRFKCRSSQPLSVEWSEHHRRVFHLRKQNVMGQPG